MAMWACLPSAVCRRGIALDGLAVSKGAKTVLWQSVSYFKNLAKEYLKFLKRQ